MLQRRLLAGIPLLLVFLFSTGICSAQNKNQDTTLSSFRIENNIIPINKRGKETGKAQTLLSRMQELNIPGVSIAVFEDGSIAWARGYGICDHQSSIVVDTATIFQAASISKPLTAVAMFALAEKKIISPDQDINLQLSSWQIPHNKYTRAEKVTPRRIVSHMGGLSVHGFRGYDQTDSVPGLLEILNGSDPANSKPVQVIYTPGAKMVYSGGGYLILQQLLEEKTGKSFPGLMKELVLKPAGMHQSLFAIKLSDSLGKTAAKGHLSNGNRVSSGYNLYPEQAAAGLWTTPSDLARFMLNVGNSFRSNQGILQQHTVQEMFTNIPPGNGSGFGIEGDGNKLRFSHVGSNVGYFCYAVSFLEKGRGMVIMTNSDNGFSLIKEIAGAVYREYRWLEEEGNDYRSLCP